MSTKKLKRTELDQYKILVMKTLGFNFNHEAFKEESVISMPTETSMINKLVKPIEWKNNPNNVV
jgi:hypothetical protein